MKKVYLDVCTLCRPYDDQNAMRIRIETDAFYLILSSIQRKELEMIVSTVHFKEVGAIEDTIERTQILQLLTRNGKLAKVNSRKAIRRSNELVEHTFGIADAAHIALAEQSADFFVTTDDDILKKSKKVNLTIEVFNPVEFCMKEKLL